MRFKLHSPYQPTGDQPQAIKQLVEGLKKRYRDQTLLGVTGSGKTFTMANVIAQVQRPTLVISHNKTLAAQLAAEFKEFFPSNAVHYFVSYYDYYQPEAYLPQTDTYISKDASINEEIDRLRHAATQSLLTRGDVLVVASVSCIYGIGSPQDYLGAAVHLEVGKSYERQLLYHLNNIQYKRNDLNFVRGTFRLRGDILEIAPSHAETAWRLEFLGDKLEKIIEFDYLTGRKLGTEKSVKLFPAKHFVAVSRGFDQALGQIKQELKKRVQYFKKSDKLLEAQRLEERTNYDLEMLKAVGYVSGIENYSRHLEGREPGQPPFTLLDYFPRDFLLFIDESHQTIPQLGAMYQGDRSRKEVLVEHGFRLPSAFDNRPLKFPEFQARVHQTIYTSATPDEWEMNRSQQIVEQILRPTGLVDPLVIVRPAEGQVDDLMEEVRERIAKKQRVLVTTLTKKMAEDLAEFLAEAGLKVHYLHADIDTFQRVEILRDLRSGAVDVVVGINLLREGLDLPEVSLVAILDADQEGFLRSKTSLIQTFGRAARHLEGTVIMYADRVTRSMSEAIKETNRRRERQLDYNKKHKITPRSIVKGIADIVSQEGLAQRKEREAEKRELVSFAQMANEEERGRLIQELEAKMELAAENLEFERAAKLRDEIELLKGS